MKASLSRIVPLIFVVSALAFSNHVLSFEFPSKDIARNFFERNNVSPTPVYGVMKNKDDHVATVHGFADNLEICKEFVEILNKEGSQSTNLFSCIKLNDGMLK